MSSNNGPNEVPGSVFSTIGGLFGFGVSGDDLSTQESVMTAQNSAGQAGVSKESDPGLSGNASSPHAASSFGPGKSLSVLSNSNVVSNASFNSSTTRDLGGKRKVGKTKYGKKEDGICGTGYSVPTLENSPNLADTKASTQAFMSFYRQRKPEPNQDKTKGSAQSINPGNQVGISGAGNQPGNQAETGGGNQAGVKAMMGATHVLSRGRSGISARSGTSSLERLIGSSTRAKDFQTSGLQRAQSRTFQRTESRENAISKKWTNVRSAFRATSAFLGRSGTCARDRSFSEFPNRSETIDLVSEPGSNTGVNASYAENSNTGTNALYGENSNMGNALHRGNGKTGIQGENSNTAIQPGNSSKGSIFQSAAMSQVSNMSGQYLMSGTSATHADMPEGGDNPPGVAPAGQPIGGPGFNAQGDRLPAGSPTSAQVHQRLPIQGNRGPPIQGNRVGSNEDVFGSMLIADSPLAGSDSSSHERKKKRKKKRKKGKNGMSLNGMPIGPNGIAPNGLCYGYAANGIPIGPNGMPMQPNGMNASQSAVEQSLLQYAGYQGPYGKYGQYGSPYEGYGQDGGAPAAYSQQQYYDPYWNPLQPHYGSGWNPGGSYNGSEWVSYSKGGSGPRASPRYLKTESASDTVLDSSGGKKVKSSGSPTGSQSQLGSGLGTGTQGSLSAVHSPGGAPSIAEQSIAEGDEYQEEYNYPENYGSKTRNYVGKGVHGGKGVGKGVKKEGEKQMTKKKRERAARKRASRVFWSVFCSVVFVVVAVIVILIWWLLRPNYYACVEGRAWRDEEVEYCISLDSTTGLLDTKEDNRNNNGAVSFAASAKSFKNADSVANSASSKSSKSVSNYVESTVSTAGSTASKSAVSSAKIPSIGTRKTGAKIAVDSKVAALVSDTTGKYDASGPSFLRSFLQTSAMAIRKSKNLLEHSVGFVEDGVSFLQQSISHIDHRVGKIGGAIAKSEEAIRSSTADHNPSTLLEGLSVSQEVVTDTQDPKDSHEGKVLTEDIPNVVPDYTSIAISNQTITAMNSVAIGRSISGPIWKATDSPRSALLYAGKLTLMHGVLSSFLGLPFNTGRKFGAYLRQQIDEFHETVKSCHARLNVSIKHWHEKGYHGLKTDMKIAIKETAHSVLHSSMQHLPPQLRPTIAASFLKVGHLVGHTIEETVDHVMQHGLNQSVKQKLGLHKGSNSATRSIELQQHLIRCMMVAFNDKSLGADGVTNGYGQSLEQVQHINMAYAKHSVWPLPASQYTDKMLFNSAITPGSSPMTSVPGVGDHGTSDSKKVDHSESSYTQIVGVIPPCSAGGTAYLGFVTNIAVQQQLQAKVLTEYLTTGGAKITNSGIAKMKFTETLKAERQECCGLDTACCEVEEDSVEAVYTPDDIQARVFTSATEIYYASRMNPEDGITPYESMWYRIYRLHSLCKQALGDDVEKRGDVEMGRRGDEPRGNTGRNDDGHYHQSVRSDRYLVGPRNLQGGEQICETIWWIGDSPSIENAAFEHGRTPRNVYEPIASSPNNYPALVSFAEKESFTRRRNDEGHPEEQHGEHLVEEHREASLLEHSAHGHERSHDGDFHGEFLEAYNDVVEDLHEGYHHTDENNKRKYESSLVQAEGAHEAQIIQERLKGTKKLRHTEGERDIQDDFPVTENASVDQGRDVEVSDEQLGRSAGEDRLERDDRSTHYSCDTECKKARSAHVSHGREREALSIGVSDEQQARSVGFSEGLSQGTGVSQGGGSVPIEQRFYYAADLDVKIPKMVKFPGSGTRVWQGLHGLIQTHLELFWRLEIEKQNYKLHANNELELRYQTSTDTSHRGGPLTSLKCSGGLGVLNLIDGQWGSGLCFGDRDVYEDSVRARQGDVNARVMAMEKKRHPDWKDRKYRSALKFTVRDISSKRAKHLLRNSGHVFDDSHLNRPQNQNSAGLNPANQNNLLAHQSLFEWKAAEVLNEADFVENAEHRYKSGEEGNLSAIMNFCGHPGVWNGERRGAQEVDVDFENGVGDGPASSPGNNPVADNSGGINPKAGATPGVDSTRQSGKDDSGEPGQDVPYALLGSKAQAMVPDRTKTAKWAREFSHVLSNQVWRGGSAYNDPKNFPIQDPKYNPGILKITDSKWTDHAQLSGGAHGLVAAGLPLFWERLTRSDPSLAHAANKSKQNESENSEKGDPKSAVSVAIDDQRAMFLAIDEDRHEQYRKAMSVAVEEGRTSNPGYGKAVLIDFANPDGVNAAKRAPPRLNSAFHSEKPQSSKTSMAIEDGPRISNVSETPALAVSATPKEKKNSPDPGFLTSWTPSSLFLSTSSSSKDPKPQERKTSQKRKLLRQAPMTKDSADQTGNSIGDWTSNSSNVLSSFWSSSFLSLPTSFISADKAHGSGVESGSEDFVPPSTDPLDPVDMDRRILERREVRTSYVVFSPGRSYQMDFLLQGRPKYREGDNKPPGNEVDNELQLWPSFLTICGDGFTKKLTFGDSWHGAPGGHVHTYASPAGSDTALASGLGTGTIGVSSTAASSTTRGGNTLEMSTKESSGSELAEDFDSDGLTDSDDEAFSSDGESNRKAGAGKELYPKDIEIDAKTLSAAELATKFTVVSTTREMSPEIRIYSKICVDEVPQFANLHQQSFFKQTSHTDSWWFLGEIRKKEKRAGTEDAARVLINKMFRNLLGQTPSMYLVLPQVQLEVNKQRCQVKIHERMFSESNTNFPYANSMKESTVDSTSGANKLGGGYGNGQVNVSAGGGGEGGGRNAAGNGGWGNGGYAYGGGGYGNYGPTSSYRSSGTGTESVARGGEAFVQRGEESGGRSRTEGGYRYSRNQEPAIEMSNRFVRNPDSGKIDQVSHVKVGHYEGVTTWSTKLFRTPLLLMEQDFGVPFFHNEIGIEELNEGVEYESLLNEGGGGGYNIDSDGGEDTSVKFFKNNQVADASEYSVAGSDDPLFDVYKDKPEAFDGNRKTVVRYRFSKTLQRDVTLDAKGNPTDGSPGNVAPFSQLDYKKDLEVKLTANTKPELKDDFFEITTRKWWKSNRVDPPA